MSSPHESAQPEVLPPLPQRPRWRVWRAGALRLRRWAALLLLALAVTFATCRFSPYFSSAEFAVLYRWMALRPPRPPHPAIALIGIEKRDVDEFDRSRAASCTCGAVCRADLGRVVARVKRAGAAVVVLDLLLQHPCPVPGHDAPLVEALRLPGECVLAVSVITNPEALILSEPAAIFVGPPPMQCICASPVLYNPGGMVRGVSLVQLGVPSDLERAEKAPLQDMHVTLPPLSAAAFAASMGRPCDMPAPVLRGAMRCADVDIPTWEGACIYLLAPFMAPSSEHEQVMLINWAGPPGTFPVYRLRDVLNPGTTEDVLAQWFRNRVVIIGSMVERVNTPRLGRGRSDPRYVDQSGAVTLCGPEVHANALNTIMQRRFIQPPSWPLMWALILGCSLLVAAAVRLTHGWVATATVASAMAVLIVVSALLVWADIWVYVVTPGVAMGLSILGATVWNYARARQEAAALEREASAREEATATIVHDLKQPLAAIGGLATIIEMSQSKTPEDDKSRELLGRIQRQVQRGLSDLDEILVANPDRQLHLQPERFDLVALARDLAADQSGKSTVHEVEVRGPEAGVWIDGDPRYLARALSNLMDNAIRYWPEGGTVLVEVRAFGNEALLSVTDQGMGLPREQVPLIFERYHRAVPEGVNIPGTGLGLYSVRRIVEAHGGSVEVWSELGKGSIFTLHLPLTQPDPRVPPGGRRQ